MIELGPPFMAWMPGDLEGVGLGGLAWPWPAVLFASLAAAVVACGLVGRIPGVSPKLAGFVGLGVMLATAFWVHASLDNPRSCLRRPNLEKLNGQTVNINTASRDALIAVPGIGPATATRIIAARPLAAVEDVAKLPRVSKSSWKEMRPWLSVGNATPKPIPSPDP